MKIDTFHAKLSSKIAPLTKNAEETALPSKGFASDAPASCIGRILALTVTLMAAISCNTTRFAGTKDPTSEGKARKSLSLSDAQVTCSDAWSDSACKGRLTTSACSADGAAGQCALSDTFTKECNCAKVENGSSPPAGTLVCDSFSGSSSCAGKTEGSICGSSLDPGRCLVSNASGPRCTCAAYSAGTSFPKPLPESRSTISCSPLSMEPSCGSQAKGTQCRSKNGHIGACVDTPEATTTDCQCADLTVGMPLPPAQSGTCGLASLSRACHSQPAGTACVTSNDKLGACVITDRPSNCDCVELVEGQRLPPGGSEECGAFSDRACSDLQAGSTCDAKGALGICAQKDAFSGKCSCMPAKGPFKPTGNLPNMANAAPNAFAPPFCTGIGSDTSCRGRPLGEACDSQGKAATCAASETSARDVTCKCVLGATPPSEKDTVCEETFSDWGCQRLTLDSPCSNSAKLGTCKGSVDGHNTAQCSCTLLTGGGSGGGSGGGGSSGGSGGSGGNAGHGNLPLKAASIVVSTDAGPASRVRVFDGATGDMQADFVPYQAFTGGVRVALADMTNDKIPDIITVPGPTGGPRLSIFDGTTAQRVSSALGNKFIYEENFRGGMFVGACDVDHDGTPDLIFGTDAGGGPRVEIYSGKTQVSIKSFFAYEDSFRGGVRVAGADVDGDGYCDILTSPGSGGGPRIRIFSGKKLVTENATPDAAAIADFLAFESDYRGGTTMTAGDIDGDGHAEVIVGAEPGGGPRVVVFKHPDYSHPSSSFFAFDESTRFGARVGTADIDGDGIKEIVAVPGPGGSPSIRIFDGRSGALKKEITLPFSPIDTNGMFVGSSP